ncbi:conjugal transfer protein TraW [Novosphingobium sp. 1748]|uniref:conjugal transfer protein TraW n=1 Tax=Novosphingobium sp. 1748 TaxID=2817760 RepID=UPI00286BF1C5|nr:conjugal transfer protein TraW [Novosphingobium sp. 1748]
MWLGALMAPTGALADTSIIGRTWPIAEPDALTEIEGRSAQIPDMKAAFGPSSSWSAMKAAPLGKARVDRQRSIVPFYTLDQDIALPDGQVLYAKGTTFNPLSYVSLPQRLVVVHQAELDWAIRAAGPADFILLAAGPSGGTDPIAASERLKRPIFLLEEHIKARLGLTVAPVIVAQSGQKLVLTEVDAAKAARKASR